MERAARSSVDYRAMSTARADDSTSLCPACRTDATHDATQCARCGHPLLLDGRYRVVRELGRGGSSNAFEVVRVTDDARLALKLLNVAHIDDWKVLDHFRRQLNLLGALSHPGIPRGVEHFAIELAGVPCECLVQELIPGASLKEELERGTRRFDEESARRFLEQMLDILEYLHGFSPPIIHRDIKPANVMIRPDGAPVLIDFDTARGHAIDHSIADGTMVGTAGYVPAEQLAGRAVPASDLYGLGMTMVHLLSLREVTDLPVERMRVQFERFVNVSSELTAVLRGMIEPIVEDRFASVAAVRAALAAPRKAAAPPAGQRSSTATSSSDDRSSASPAPKHRVERSPSRLPSSPPVAGAIALDASLRDLSRGPAHAGAPIGAAVRVSAELTSWSSEQRYVWPIDASASSTYGGRWSPTEAIGQPKVFPRHGDLPGAWAPRSARGQVEWLEVRFPPASQYPPAIQVHVFETCSPGAIYGVEIGQPDGARSIIYVDAPREMYGVAQRLEIKLPQPTAIESVRVWLDTSVGAGFNEIDTIALLAERDVTDLPAQARATAAPRDRHRLIKRVVLILIAMALVAWLLSYCSDDLSHLSVDETLGDTQVHYETELVPGQAFWASQLVEQSSNWGGAADWHGEQALWAPNVFPLHADDTRAWASEDPDGGIEYVTVTFSTPVHAKSVLIVETFNPGAVMRVDDLTDGGATALWSGTASPASSSRIMRLDLAQPRTIDTLRVVLDTRRVSGWNELDAIGLIAAE